MMGDRERAPRVDKRDGLYIANDAPQVACDNHCGTHVEARHSGVEYKRGHTVVLVFFFIIQCIFLIRVTRDCTECQTS